MKTELIDFEKLEIGDYFFDPCTGEDYLKVCGNAAEFLSGGSYFSGQLATFDPKELIQKIKRG